mgnify:CR=1 FL=1
MRQIPLESRTDSTIAAEWDEIAPLRAQQILNGADHSAKNVLAPTLIRMTGAAERLLDIGCGTGWLSGLLSEHCGCIIGIDSSGTSIRLASQTIHKPNVQFIHASIEIFSATNPSLFSAAIANMTLSALKSLPLAVAAIRGCLATNATFSFTIPHPCFWPAYWGYATAPWFKYEVETAIEAPFRIATQKCNFVTTHVHRPLSQYVKILRDANFELEEFEELVGQGFSFPRFIAMRWRATLPRTKQL